MTMPDVFALIISIGQLVTAGIELSRTLYDYGTSVAEAEGRLQGVEMEVRLTCSILEQLVSQLKRKRVQWMLSENTIQTTRDAVTACEDRFKALQAYLNKIRQSGARAKWTFYFRQAKIEELRDDLDRMIGRLDVMINIIGLEIQGRSLLDALLAKLRQSIRGKEASDTTRVLADSQTSSELLLKASSNSADSLPNVVWAKRLSFRSEKAPSLLSQASTATVPGDGPPHAATRPRTSHDTRTSDSSNPPMK